MPPSLAPKKTILDAEQLRRLYRRIAGEILERDAGTSDLLLVGIRTRGVPFAERLAAEIEAMEGATVPVGVLDITLYRDDLSTIAPQPVVKASRFPVPLDDRVVVLCDDVLYTGRTIRAALDALIDYGRPRAVRLAVVVDRGLRELPIQADFVGQVVPTSADEHVEVRFRDTDDAEDVRILEQVGEG
ncbi:MAG TPA: bifunctional pyr operon transcriptional regulator/uracil phosphoribosyltransferase PyrR [Thermoanaerobaculia bacterium]|nr:bifunctional pyr operon transcriptional regulator/uracil phosphoribosyltransferase PyrR [Thermoanaerobaculia bacterium]